MLEIMEIEAILKEFMRQFRKKESAKISQSMELDDNLFQYSLLVVKRIYNESKSDLKKN